MAAAGPPACLESLPRDCWLRVLQADCDGAPALSLRDLAALLQTARCFAPTVADAAAARVVALLGAAATFNTPLTPAQQLLRLALAQRVEGDIAAAGFTAAAMTMRTTVVHKTTGRVASYGDTLVAGRPGVPRDRIRSCRNENGLSLVVCEPAVCYIFGWHHGNFLWHERTYAALPPSPSLLRSPSQSPVAAPQPPPLVPVAAAPPPLPAAEGELSLEERVAMHLRRVRFYIANRNTAMMLAAQQ